jgi:hypothetical protein
MPFPLRGTPSSSFLSKHVPFEFQPSAVEDVTRSQASTVLALLRQAIYAGAIDPDARNELLHLLTYVA